MIVFLTQWRLSWNEATIQKCQWIRRIISAKYHDSFLPDCWSWSNHYTAASESSSLKTIRKWDEHPEMSMKWRDPLLARLAPSTLRSFISSPLTSAPQVPTDMWWQRWWLIKTKMTPDMMNYSDKMPYFHNAYFDQWQCSEKRLGGGDDKGDDCWLMMTKTRKARPDDDDSDNLDDKLMSDDLAKDHWSTDDWPFKMGRGHLVFQQLSWGRWWSYLNIFTITISQNYDHDFDVDDACYDIFNADDDDNDDDDDDDDKLKGSSGQWLVCQ